VSETRLFIYFQALFAIGLAVLAVALRSSTSSALLGVALSQLTGLGQTLMGVSCVSLPSHFRPPPR